MSLINSCTALLACLLSTLQDMKPPANDSVRRPCALSMPPLSTSSETRGSSLKRSTPAIHTSDSNHSGTPPLTPPTSSIFSPDRIDSAISLTARSFEHSSKTAEPSNLVLRPMCSHPGSLDLLVQLPTLSMPDAAGHAEANDRLEMYIEDFGPMRSDSDSCLHEVVAGRSDIFGEQPSAMMSGLDEQLDVWKDWSPDLYMARALDGGKSASLNHSTSNEPHPASQASSRPTQEETLQAWPISSWPMPRCMRARLRNDAAQASTAICGDLVVCDRGHLRVKHSLSVRRGCDED